MSARKLYIGIEAPETIATELARSVGLPEESVNQLPPHITVQWCGPSISDDDAEQIKSAWTHEMRAANLRPMRDDLVSTTGELALYGKDKNCLVALCEVSSAFTAMVAAARARACAAIDAIPASDFGFSPHITLGTAMEIPDHATVPATSFAFDTLTMWGDNGDVRDTIYIPFADS